MTEPKHRHCWAATLYDGRWVEYCQHGCGAVRPARINRYGVPVAMPRTSPGFTVERAARHEAER